MIVKCGDYLVGNKIEVAGTFRTRLVGLLGKNELKKGEGLLLLKCGMIHCFFMKISIDAVYLSKDMRVVGMETLKPWRIGSYIKNARHVLELSEGSIANHFKIGDQLVLLEMNVER